MMDAVELVLVTRNAGGLEGVILSPVCWRLRRAVSTARLALADPSGERRMRPCSTCLPTEHYDWWSRWYNAVRPDGYHQPPAPPPGDNVGDDL